MDPLRTITSRPRSLRRPRAVLSAVAALGLAALLLTASGCTEDNCGPGTHAQDGTCVANIPADCTGPGVEFVDGVCQVRASVCPDGSEFDPDLERCTGSVTSTNNGTNNTTIADAGPGDVDPGDTSTGDVDPDATGDDASQDVLPDLPPPGACGASSPSGTICLSGGLVNWANNQPLTGAEPVGIVLDDLTLRSTVPNKPPFAVTGLLGGGTFVFSDVPVTSNDGPLTSVILIADEGDGAPTDDWQRTLTGSPIVVNDGDAYPDQTAFVVPNVLVQAWDGLLGRSGEQSIANTGFLLIRILTPTDSGLLPLPNATVRNTDPEQDATVTKHYLTDDLTGFRPENTTGNTGAVLILGAPIGQYTADQADFAFASTLGGTFPGLAITTVILGERL